MDTLGSELEAIQRRRTSDAVWAAVDAALLVLSEFRKLVAARSLAVSPGKNPYYTFDPAKIVANPATNEVANTSAWSNHRAFVLGVLRDSTGLDVRWGGEGAPIELHATRGDQTTACPAPTTPPPSPTACPTPSPTACPAPSPTACPAPTPTACPAPVPTAWPAPAKSESGDSKCPVMATHQKVPGADKCPVLLAHCAPSGADAVQAQEIALVMVPGESGLGTFAERVDAAVSAGETSLDVKASFVLATSVKPLTSSPSPKSAKMPDSGAKGSSSRPDNVGPCPSVLPNPGGA